MRSDYEQVEIALGQRPLKRAALVLAWEKPIVRLDKQQGDRVEPLKAIREKTSFSKPQLNFGNERHAVGNQFECIVHRDGSNV